MVRTDSAGGTHDFVAWLSRRGRWLSYSVGKVITDAIHQHVLKVPASAWTPAVEADGESRDGAWLAELTGAVLHGWPKGMRLIVRKEWPHPGVQLRLTGPPACGTSPCIAPHPRCLKEQVQKVTGSACAKGPTLNVVEDVHLAPKELQGLLQAYTRTLRETPLAVLCTVRDRSDPTTEGFLAELERCGAEVIPLAPLTQAAVRRATSAARVSPVSQDAARRLHELGGGNLFPLHQILKHDRHAGSAPRSPGSWPGELVSVPSAVRSIATARLAELSPGARQVIDRRRCSVAGRTCRSWPDSAGFRFSRH